MYSQYIIIFTLFCYSLPVFAGNLAPPAPPSSPDSAMYTLEDVYQRLDKGTPGEQRSGSFMGPGGGPADESTWMHTTDEIMSIAPEINDNAAQPSDVAAGKTYWSLSVQGWGVQTGTKGNSCFVDNGDGTVTDTRTGLIWLKDANCFGTKTWKQADSAVNSLQDGNCGLEDGSQAGDWRLPEVWALQTLLDYTHYGPALFVNHPFTNVQSINYWSATRYIANPTYYAWEVNLDSGRIETGDLTRIIYILPVRSE